VGYIEQASSSVTARPSRVGGEQRRLGHERPADNAAGFAQASSVSAHEYAPTPARLRAVMWAPSPTRSPARPARSDRRAGRAFDSLEQSLGATFDLVFTDPARPRRGLRQYITATAARVVEFGTTTAQLVASSFVNGVGLRMVLWQIRWGNTKCWQEHNVGPLQDNHVQWWFDDTSGHLAATVNAGVSRCSSAAARAAPLLQPTRQACVTTGCDQRQHDRFLQRRRRWRLLRHQANAYYAAGARCPRAAGLNAERARPPATAHLSRRHAGSGPRLA